MLIQKDYWNKINAGIYMIAFNHHISKMVWCCYGYEGKK